MIFRIILITLYSLTLYATPTWYHNLTKQGPSFYIGYGQGFSEVDAKKAALNDISSQISVIVDSSISSDMGINKGKTYKNIQDKSSLRSHAQIQGYTVKKLEFYQGHYYIALSYENIPSIDKFNRKLTYIPLDKKPKIYNRYLQQTPIAQKLEKKVDFSLSRKDGIWYIQYKDIYQALDEKDFLYFFTTVNSSSLSITTSKYKNVLYDGDEFFFKLKSKEKGYVTIFTVYEDGTVTKLISNIYVQKNKTEYIPDKDFESILQAGLLEAGKETFDLYIVVRTSKKQHFDQFARADEELISDERYKNFDELIELMGEMEFVTLKLVTKPR